MVDVAFTVTSVISGALALSRLHTERSNFVRTERVGKVLMSQLVLLAKLKTFISDMVNWTYNKDNCYNWNHQNYT